MRVMMAKHMKRSARGMRKNDDSAKQGEEMFWERRREKEKEKEGGLTDAE